MLKKNRILPLVETALFWIHSTTFIATMNPFAMIPMIHSMAIIMKIKIMWNGNNSFSWGLQVSVILSPYSSLVSGGKCLPRIWWADRSSIAPTIHVTGGSSWCSISKFTSFVYLRILSSKSRDANDRGILFLILSHVLLDMLVLVQLGDPGKDLRRHTFINH